MTEPGLQIIWQILLKVFYFCAFSQNTNLLTNP